MKTLREYLKIAEAAKFLGISQNTLRKWADEGRIPVYVNKANGYRLFLENDLEKFLTQIEDSGQFPTGWKRPTRRKRKPR